MVFGEQAVVDTIGGTSQGLQHAAQPMVCFPGDTVAFTVFPKLQQGKLEQRQGGRFAHNLADEGFHQPFFKFEADQISRFFDGFAQFGGTHRPHAHLALAHQSLEKRVFDEIALVISAHGKDDAVLLAATVDQAEDIFDKGLPFGSIVAEGEQFFKLVNDKNGRFPCPRIHQIKQMVWVFLKFNHMLNHPVGIIHPFWLK